MAVDCAFYCPDCIPDELRARLGDEDVQTWETYSSGWTSAPLCISCDLAIPVYVNAAEQPCPGCGAPLRSCHASHQDMHCDACDRVFPVDDEGKVWR